MVSTTKAKPSKSRPPRARGLKHFLYCPHSTNPKVAPPAGAWIETGALLLNTDHYYVAPPRARGLKHLTTLINQRLMMVAPPAGAWIETYSARLSRLYPQSRPPRARGLKQWLMWLLSVSLMSRPPRARGLKLRITPVRNICQRRAPRGRVD